MLIGKTHILLGKQIEMMTWNLHHIPDEPRVVLAPPQQRIVTGDVDPGYGVQMVSLGDWDVGIAAEEDCWWR